MNLPSWQKRLANHQRKIDRLETSGEMDEIYRYNKPRFRKLYQRLGFLQARCETLEQERAINMQALVTGIKKRVSERVEANRDGERMTMQLFMYNHVDRRTKVYRNWIKGEITLSDAYAKAKARA